MEAKHDDEDDSFIEISSEPINPSPSKAPGLSLNLGRRVDADKKDTSDEGIMTRQLESPIMIVFELPDGSTVEEEFKMGQSVEVLKVSLLRFALAHQLHTRNTRSSSSLRSQTHRRPSSLLSLAFPWRHSPYT